MRTSMGMLLAAGLAVSGSIAQASSLPPSEMAQIKAMDGEALMTAVAQFDSQLASDLARLSNIEAMATVCSWKDLDFGVKRTARLNMIASDRDKAIAERFYAGILAKDIASYRKDKPEELCTAGNKDYIAQVHSEW